MKIDVLERYRGNGFRAAINYWPDTREHYREPYRSAYIEGFEEGAEYCRRESIGFWDAKAAIVVRIAGRQ